MYKKKPAPPKRPLTGYFRFRGDVYKSTVANNPKLAPKQIMSLIGSKWSKLSNAAKNRYNAAWKADQGKYQAAKARYEKKYGKIVRNADPDVDPNRPAPPKRPINGFFRYVSEVLASFKSKYPRVKHSAVVSKIGKKWGSFSDSVKKPYNDAYEKEKTSYGKKRAAFEKKWGPIKNRRRKKRGKGKKVKKTKKSKKTKKTKKR